MKNKPMKQASQVAAEPPKPDAAIPSRTLSIILLAVILIFVSLIRIRLLSFPLERDEGEYAYFGQLILDGIPPYSMAYNLKLPGTYYTYAMIMAVFGQTIKGIRIGLLFFNLGSLILVYRIARKLFSEFAGIIAAATSALLFRDLLTNRTNKKPRHLF